MIQSFKVICHKGICTLQFDLQIQCSPFLKLKFFFLNWRIIALPLCAGFCHTTTQASPTYICLSAVLVKIPTLFFMQFDKQSKVLYITKRILKMQNKKSSVFPDSRAYCTHHISEGSVVLVLV